MLKIERTDDLVNVNDVILVGDIGATSGLSLCPTCKQPSISQRERPNARLRYSPSQRGGTPPCLEGLGSIQRSGGIETVGSGRGHSQ